MQVSYSRIDSFKSCPYKYKLRYIDKLETLPNYDPTNALILGSALHKGIEIDVETAIKEYKDFYPVMTDAHINEIIKLEYWIPKVKELLPDGKHEVEIKCDDFIGFIDLLAPVKLTSEECDDICCDCNKNEKCEYCNSGRCPNGNYDNYFDIYDFKYSNNVSNYMKSQQLHLYKYYFEKLNPNCRIRNLYFVFVPKSQLKLKYKNKTNKRDETIYELRQRTLTDLKNKEIQIVPIEYDANKVIEFLTNTKHAIECVDYSKNESRLCDWCDYKTFCQSNGEIDFDILRKDGIYMNLPSTERRTVEANSHKKIWFYGTPFSGKTYLANEFPTPLMLNTDGNIKYVDAPFIAIKDEVTTEGRITKRKYAWEVFTEAVDELEKGGNDFETIVVDLLEDVYDACRVKVCADRNWEHESDDSFKAYDIVRNEFLRTLKRLLNLDYNIVLISHEDTSRDITKKSSDKVTSIKPNIPEKVANKVAGMVDIVARLVNDEGVHKISFKTSDVVFGGGRLKIADKEIESDYNELCKVYEGVEPTKKKTTRKPKELETADKPPVEVETPETPVEETPEESVEEAPKTRTRKSRKIDEDAEMDEAVRIEIEPNSGEPMEPPKRRTRRTRSEAV